MGLNNIELPPLVLSGLYKNALVKPDEPTIPAEPGRETAYKFFGGNNKKVSIIVQSSDAVFINDTQLSFLSKLLEACKMNIGDVSILNSQQEPIIIGELKSQLHPRSVILFGVPPISIKLPIDFPMFKLQEYDACTYLYAPALETLDQDTNEGKILKSKLWVCLKSLFGL